MDDREQISKDTLFKLEEDNHIYAANIDKKTQTNALEIDHLKSKMLSCQKMVFEN